MSARQNRNAFVDIMRGFAMLLVVLGHTMTGCTVDAQKSFLFNIVWSLQMPLFILISGYVTKYSRSIQDIKSLWNYIKRRTAAYMFPWAVWSFLVRGVIFGEKAFLNIKHILWNMDSGYWFLATIWTISIIFGVSSFLANRIVKASNMKKQGVLLSAYLLGMILLVGIGLIAGMRFFAIKLTLYYMPFYYVGYLYGQIDDTLMNHEKWKYAKEGVIMICFGVWLFIILRLSLYEMPDSGLAIALRAIISLTGCTAVCGLCKGFFSSAKSPGGGIKLIGSHSLEVYLVHYLLLGLIKSNQDQMICSPTGTGLIVMNCIVTVLLTLLIITMIEKNDVMRLVLFGKKD